MKKLLSLAAALIVTVGAYAQGSVNFTNFVPPGLDAPVFNVDGSTRLDGPGFMAQLYAGPDQNSLAAVGAATPFLAGAGAGYFAGGSRQIPTVAPGSMAWIQVVAWDSASGGSFDAASVKGSSTPFQVTTGGAGQPPSLPANLTGLTSFSLVPEPSTFALGILGAALLLWRRRK